MKIHLTTLLIFFLTTSVLFAQKAINVSLYNEAAPVFVAESAALGHVAVRNMISLNSNDMDYSPLLYKDGIVFTSTRVFETKKKRWFKSYKKKFSYLFFAKRDERGQFNDPKPLEGGINGRYHEGAATFNKQGDVMFFTRNNKKGKNQFGKVDLKIYTAKFNDGNWDEIEEIEIINGEGFSTCHPTISADGQKLFFASNRNGGYGGMDIYVSYLVDGEWQYPVNLGPEINTDGNEIFPFIAQGNKLYFSSDGHDGKGGLDIFQSNWIDETNEEDWTTALNMGLPFNSVKDDFGFSIYNNNQEGFFTSTREGGQGYDDIYTWRKEYIPRAELSK
ncbi:MAG: TolB family protein [Saprospiraceae bacterium]